MLDEPPEFIPVDKQSDDQIVHTFGLRKADRPAHQPLEPRPRIDVFALDFLGVLFADGVLLGLDMPLIGAPDSAWCVSSSVREYQIHSSATPSNAGDRIATLRHWRAGREGNRAEGEPLCYPRRPLRECVCKTGCYRFSTPLAICTGNRASQREEIEQDKVHLSKVEAERMGKARRTLDMRSVLR